MVNSGAVTGQQLCLLLFDQGVLDYDDATVATLLMAPLVHMHFLWTK